MTVITQHPTSCLSFRREPGMYSWWQYSQLIDHVYQPPLQLGPTILLIIIRSSRHRELPQRLLNLNDWPLSSIATPIVGTFKSTQLLRKWSSNSSKHPEFLISYSLHTISPAHIPMAFPSESLLLHCSLLLESPTIPQFPSTHPWKPV